MNKLPILLTLLLTSVFTGYGQCSNPFYTMEEGRHYQVESYNGKDKLEATMEYTVSSVNEINNGYEATIASKTLDKKGKEVASGDMVVMCQDGVLKMDIQGLLNAMKQLRETKGMDIDIQGDHLSIPASLDVGDTLPSSTTTMTMKTEDNSMTMSTMNFTINQRTVAAQEDLTTAAGTFPCYKITYTMDMNVKVMGMGRTTSYTGAEWIAEGVGMVRNEQYDADGALSSYSVLTKAE